MLIRQVLVEKIKCFDINDKNQFESQITHMLSFCVELQVFEELKAMADDGESMMSTNC